MAVEHLMAEGVTPAGHTTNWPCTACVPVVRCVLCLTIPCAHTLNARPGTVVDLQVVHGQRRGRGEWTR